MKRLWPEEDALVPSWFYLWRKVPNGLRGKYRLARALMKRTINLHDVDLEVDGNLFRVPVLKEHMAFSALINGAYEPETLRFFERHLKSDSVFLDVGANIGLLSVTVATKLVPSGRVLALEASPSIFPYLERNRTRNAASNLITENVAVSARDGGTASFYEANMEQHGMGSLTQRFNGAPVEVPRVSIDCLLAKHGITSPAVMKVDVEGFERDVFEGARKLLTGPSPPIILFEFVDWAERSAEACQCGDAQRLLQSMDYSLWDLGDYLAGGEAPLSKPMVSGTANLVAVRR